MTTTTQEILEYAADLSLPIRSSADGTRHLVGTLTPCVSLAIWSRIDAIESRREMLTPEGEVVTEKAPVSMVQAMGLIDGRGVSHA